MKRVNKNASVNLTGKVGEKWSKSAETCAVCGSQKKPCLTAVVIQKLTTETLAIPGVEVVKNATGKVFAGPFYTDQIELLRDTLTKMPRRENHIVVDGGVAFWIHRKPTSK